MQAKHDQQPDEIEGAELDAQDGEQAGAEAHQGLVQPGAGEAIYGYSTDSALANSGTLAMASSTTWMPAPGLQAFSLR